MIDPNLPLTMNLYEVDAERTATFKAEAAVGDSLTAFWFKIMFYQWVAMGRPTVLHVTVHDVIGT